MTRLRSFVGIGVFLAASGCGGGSDDPPAATGGTGTASGGGGTSSGGAGATSGGTLSTGGSSGGTAASTSGGAATSGGKTGGGAGAGGASAGAGGQSGGSAGNAGGGSSGSGGASGGAGGQLGGAGGQSGSGGGGAGAGGQSGGGGGGQGGGSGKTEFALSSPEWEAVDNEDCTDDATATCPLYPQESVSPMLGGANESPEMSWTAGPEGTLSYAIVLHDLSAGFVHWALFDIPPTTTMLPPELPAGTLESGARQAGFNAGGSASYFGSGACGNVYEHRLYALDVATLTVQGQVTAQSVRTAIEELRGSGGILAESFVRLQSRDYCTP